MVFPPALYLPSGSSIHEFDEEPWEDIERDPRGILLMFEPRRSGAKYIMGMDSSEGITGWSRATRQPDDKKIDNGAIEVYEIGAIREPVWKIENGKKVPEIDKRTRRQKIHFRDVQVAEFRAPCDAVEIARIANIIGRIYHDDDGEPAELIWESWPGCGMLCTQELLRLQYGNLWHWEYISDVAEETDRLGWRSNRESMKLLWYRTRRHLMQENVVIRSKWLRQEYADAVIDYDKMRAMADYGDHDDLMMASNLALWAGNRWTYEMESSQEVATENANPTDFQNYAPGLGDDASWETWKSEQMSGWEGWE